MTLQAKTTRRSSEIKEAALAEVTAEPTKRLNVEIPARLHRQVKTTAAVADTTIVDIVTAALTEYLEKRAQASSEPYLLVSMWGLVSQPSAFSRQCHMLRPSI